MSDPQNTSKVISEVSSEFPSVLTVKLSLNSGRFWPIYLSMLVGTLTDLQEFDGTRQSLNVKPWTFVVVSVKVYYVIGHSTGKFET